MFKSRDYNIIKWCHLMNDSSCTLTSPWPEHRDTVHGCFEGTFRDSPPYPFGLMFPETYEQEVRCPTRQSMKQKPLQRLYAAWKRVSSEILSLFKKQTDASAQKMQRRMGRTSLSQRIRAHRIPRSSSSLVLCEWLQRKPTNQAFLETGGFWVFSLGEKLFFLVAMVI